MLPGVKRSLVRKGVVVSKSRVFINGVYVGGGSVSVDYKSGGKNDIAVTVDNPYMFSAVRRVSTQPDQFGVTVTFELQDGLFVKQQIAWILLQQNNLADLASSMARNIASSLESTISERISEALFPYIKPTPAPLFSNEHVLGFRSWNARLIYPRKNSVPVGVYCQPWETPIKRAECCSPFGVERYKHKAPAWQCECGIYLWKEFRPQLDLTVAPDLFTGLCRASGTIIEHEHGYRAETVECVALIAPPKTLRPFIGLSLQGAPLPESWLSLPLVKDTDGEAANLLAEVTNGDFKETVGEAIDNSLDGTILPMKTGRQKVNERNR